MSSATDPKIDSLKKLGRSALIDLAVKKINDPDFDKDQYDRIVVKASDEALIVEFGLSIAFKKRRSCYYDVVWVALAGSGTGKSVMGECDEPEYFKRSKSEQQAIDSIFEAINKSDEIGHIKDKKLSGGTKMDISEHATYYYVETSSWSTYSYFKVNKLTGKISDAGHKHYARDNDEKDEFEIIKD
jgi:hypothetical protein